MVGARGATIGEIGIGARKDLEAVLAQEGSTSFLRSRLPPSDLLQVARKICRPCQIILIAKGLG